MTNASHCLSVLLMALLATPAVPGIASAKRKPQTATTAEAPRGQREAKDITYGDWKKLCFKAGGAPLLCRTSITGSFATGQLAVRIDLIEREGDKRARLQMFVPVGMYLRHPAKLSVDQGGTYRVPYNWCVTNACIAADVADPKLIKEMEAGTRLVLEVVDSNLLKLTTALPLATFASVRNGAPAQTLEQELEE